MLIGMTSKPMIISAGAAIIGLIIGGIIGHYATPRDQPLTDRQEQIINEYNGAMNDASEAHTKFLLNSINPDNLRENLRILTEKPHIAGSMQDEVLADLFEERWKAAGFDWVEKVGYRILLSKPHPTQDNVVALLNNNQEEFRARNREVPILESDAHPDFVPAFNAYTPPGEVTTDKFIYCNYGQIEDFVKLTEELGVDVTDSIVIVRYGKIFRGNKIDNAYKFGAKAVIIYSDPQDVALEGQEPENVYNYTFWLPGTGMQRGTTYIGDGDPLTPGWPSTSFAYRIPQSEAELPKIPAQPIGYADAVKFLEQMGGQEAPEEWKGGINGITYRVGPQMNTGYQVKIQTHNIYENQTSYNVIGAIKGSVEPDRYVLIGNHRDAWGFGASDPSSGSSQILETARVLGELLKTGWRPKRTIVFCSWGAEEYGLIGSVEWVEEHITRLQERSIAYINTDTCASGPILQAKSSPLMWDMIKDVTQKVPGIQDPTKTVFDEWKANDELRYPNEMEYPKMNTLGSGSDYGPFTFFGGIPSLDIWFRADKAKYNISMYPSYHTGYETFHMLSSIVDPEFKIHQGCGRVAILTLMSLADSKILPLNIARFPEAMNKGAQAFDKNGLKDKIMSIYQSYTILEEYIGELQEKTIMFMNQIKEQDLTINEVRAVNDILRTFEQIFVIPEGLPGRPMVRHAIFAPSQFDNYAAAGFPGISDILYDYDNLTPEEKEERNVQLKKHVSHLTILAERAISFLNDYENFN